MELSLASVLWRLAGISALVLANGFFVSAEFAIVTVRKTRIDQLIAEGDRRARAVRRAISAPDRYIAATQLGITMTSLGLGWVGEPALASIIEPWFSFLPPLIAATTVHSIAVAIAFTVITAIHIVFGELAPKWVALERSEMVALWVVKPTEIFMRVFWPFIHVLHAVARWVVQALGVRGTIGYSMVHSEEELKMLVTASQEAGVLEEHEEQMLHRVFEFADITAGQVMLPRTELVAIAGETSGNRMLEQIATAGYPTLPVYRNDLDNVIGILYVTDVIRAIVAGKELSAASLAHEALTVPETMTADDLLSAFRRRRTREAIVIDEYGGTAGLVTFEWLMERIVGGVAHLTNAGNIAVRPDGSAEIDGLALVTDVNEQFGLQIDEETYTTFGGYVLGRIGRRVRVGDEIDVDGRKARVIAIDGLRVEKVWLSKPAQTQTTDENAPAE
jgi:CBS domain containing-hemolysin-like protein